jgi:hypothetical protein
MREGEMDAHASVGDTIHLKFYKGPNLLAPQQQNRLARKRNDLSTSDRNFNLKTVRLGY